MGDEDDEDHEAPDKEEVLLIVLAVVGGVLALAIFVGAFIFWKKYRGKPCNRK